jgi:hypothetical protein
MDRKERMKYIVATWEVSGAERMKRAMRLIRFDLRNLIVDYLPVFGIIGLLLGMMGVAGAWSQRVFERNGATGSAADAAILTFLAVLVAQIFIAWVFSRIYRYLRDAWEYASNHDVRKDDPK